MPEVTTYNPTPPWLQPGQEWFAELIKGLLQDPQKFLGMAGPKPTNYSANALGQVNPALMALLNQKATPQFNPFKELQFTNEFKELQNPFGDMGAVNQAFQVLAAATPTFDRNLKAANTNLATTAPGRFSSAIARQGTDLNATALQDFNLFANTALQQGLTLQNQQQQAALNFLLGSRDLQQGAVANTRQSQLGARDLQQNAEFTTRQLNETNRQNTAANALGAAGTMGNIAGDAGRFDQAQYATILQAIIAMMQQGGNVFNPTQNTPVVGQSGTDKLMGWGNLLAALWQSGLLGDIGKAVGIGGNKTDYSQYYQPVKVTPQIPNKRGF